MENNEISRKRPTQIQWTKIWPRTKATEWRLEQSFQQVVSELKTQMQKKWI